MTTLAPVFINAHTHYQNVAPAELPATPISLGLPVTADGSAIQQAYSVHVHTQVPADCTGPIMIPGAPLRQVVQTSARTPTNACSMIFHIYTDMLLGKHTLCSQIGKGILDSLGPCNNSNGG